jgi:hypothetical protein
VRPPTPVTVALAPPVLRVPPALERPPVACALTPPVSLAFVPPPVLCLVLTPPVALPEAPPLLGATVVDVCPPALDVLREVAPPVFAAPPTVFPPPPSAEAPPAPACVVEELQPATSKTRLAHKARAARDPAIDDLMIVVVSKLRPDDQQLIGSS